MPLGDRVSILDWLQVRFIDFTASVRSIAAAVILRLVEQDEVEDNRPGAPLYDASTALPFTKFRKGHLEWLRGCDDSDHTFLPFRVADNSYSVSYVKHSRLRTNGVR